MHVRGHSPLTDVSSCIVKRQLILFVYQQMLIFFGIRIVKKL